VLRSYVPEARRRGLGRRRERIGPVVDRLASEHADARIALRFRSDLELLVSVMLSAQTTDVNVNRVRRGIGIVFQAFNLFPHMTVLRNVTLGPRKALGLSRAEAEQEATELLARFGLADKRGEYPDRLSGGQQQRAAIVRALAMRPDLMLLDEVTSALDPELVGEVLEVIRELAEEGMTMLIATHEMSFARDIASRVCFLDAGVILEQGPPDEIFTAPREPRTQEFLRRIVEAGRL